MVLCVIIYVVSLPYNLNTIRLILLLSLQKRIPLSSDISMCDHTAVTTAEYAREYEYIPKSLFLYHLSII